jgi:hypothetical protein
MSAPSGDNTDRTNLHPKIWARSAFDAMIVRAGMASEAAAVSYRRSEVVRAMLPRTSDHAAIYADFADPYPFIVCCQSARAAYSRDLLLRDALVSANRETRPASPRSTEKRRLCICFADVEGLRSNAFCFQEKSFKPSIV